MTGQEEGESFQVLPEAKKSEEGHEEEEDAGGALVEEPVSKDEPAAEPERVGESRSSIDGGAGGVEVRESRVETLASASSAGLRRNDECEGSSRTSSAPIQEVKENVQQPHQEVLASVTGQMIQMGTKNEPQLSLCPLSTSELSPTSVTQSISSVPSPTALEQTAATKVTVSCMPEQERRPLPRIPAIRTSSRDGYNWRKYGQKQVKSPNGSRSYFRCTNSECSAKKIECSDQAGHILETVYRSHHNHDPPKKVNGMHDSKLATSMRSVSEHTPIRNSTRGLSDSDPSTSSKELVRETPAIRNSQHEKLDGFSGNVGNTKENVNETAPKQRGKNKLSDSDPLLKPGKKPKFVVHAAGDVGISADGYRWRKYGQKMVKGNPHPRNYYRCTSAGCPVRKHVETAADNASAVTITYKGIHDHDMPVPKKRHGPPSAPLIAATASASMSSSQIRKIDASKDGKASTQWTVDSEGELTGEAMDLGGEKAMESARTLLSIGFEIKPC